MTVFVKICGLTDANAVDAAVDAGADAVGFVFHPPSPRHLTPQRAAVLARRVPPEVLRVAVTLHPRPAEVAEILESFVPDAWQSDAGDFAAFSLADGIERWHVLRGGIARTAMGARRVLFESPASGSGARADWTRAAAVARRCELILGGGLDAVNVGCAIAEVRPFGVDVSSGVERMPGVKDPRRIREFVRAVRRADAA
jgi:phosphoribosylanthranilate isomerase